MKKLLIVTTAILFSLCLTGIAFAFHEGGVAHCDGCHSMHAGSGNGYFVSQGPSLTNGADPSSTCLNCHDGNARYHVNSTDGSNTNEGGDFHWIQNNNYTYDVRGTPTAVDRNNFGHNIVASDYGLTADAVLTAAPGGTFPAADLGCTSCHDPHGEVSGATGPISVSGSYGDDPAALEAGSIAGNYRLLGDSGYSLTTGGGTVNFSNDAPIARASGSDGASVQYGEGMSGWCANCHGGFYFAATGPALAAGMHPTEVGSKAAYATYVASGSTSGDPLVGYDPLVPIERGGVLAGSWDLPDPDPAGLDPAASVGTGGQVMCLTCHRAHASPFANALRWDGHSELIAETWQSASTNVPATAVEYYKHGAEIQIADAADPFEGGYGTAYQRSLCNKCHVQD